MESGAKGCEVVVSGKLRGQRAKSMKFVDGLMIHSGDPVNYYVDTAVRHVLLRQGECEIKSSLKHKKKGLNLSRWIYIIFVSPLSQITEIIKLLHNILSF